MDAGSDAKSGGMAISRRGGNGTALRGGVGVPVSARNSAAQRTPGLPYRVDRSQAAPVSPPLASRPTAAESRGRPGGAAGGSSCP
jgi:hypothetical protein